MAGEGTDHGEELDGRLACRRVQPMPVELRSDYTDRVSLSDRNAYFELSTVPMTPAAEQLMEQVSLLAGWGLAQEQSD
jgi:hypothetical protein